MGQTGWVWVGRLGREINSQVERLDPKSKDLESKDQILGRKIDIVSKDLMSYGRRILKMVERSYVGRKISILGRKYYYCMNRVFNAFIINNFVT